MIMDKYIFVSYAHKDSETVYPIISALQSAGYNVWYDRGIEAGTEWPAYIEENLNKCECVLVCLSPAAIDSVNCRNEINLACQLNKKMLIVYLQETRLIMGMNLQLNSKQSLYKYRHVSDESFLGELVNASILMSCKDSSGNRAVNDKRSTADNDRDDYGASRTETISRRLAHRPEIARVGTMGSNTPGMPWPKGEYSQTLNVAKFCAVHFHCSLIRPCDRSGNREVGLRIYDSNDNLVFENLTTLHFNMNDQRFSLGWLVKDENGLAQGAGTYTAVMWLDGSRAFEYTFTLVNVIEKKDIAAPRKKTVYEVTNGKQYIYMTLLCLAAFITSNISIAQITNEGGFISVVFGLFWLAATISLYRKTRKYVTAKKLYAVLLSFVVTVYYGIYLLVKTVLFYTKNTKLDNPFKNQRSGK